MVLPQKCQIWFCVLEMSQTHQVVSAQVLAKQPDVFAQRLAMAAIHPGVNVDQQSVPYKWKKQLCIWRTLEGKENISDSDSEPEDFRHCSTVNSECGSGHPVLLLSNQAAAMCTRQL